MTRINRAIELLEQGQAIYYVGHHTGHVLTHAQGREDARTWADYINVGMEHGAFDMAGPGASTCAGWSTAGRPAPATATPAVIVEPPVRGTDEASVRANAWQLRQILARGVHGMILCQAESADAVRAFVEAARYPHHVGGVDPSLPPPLERMREPRRTGSAPRLAGGRHLLGVGTRGRGSEADGGGHLGIVAPGLHGAQRPLAAQCRRASCCSASSSRARRASPTARRSWPCRGSASRRWARAISGSRSAI